MNQDMEDEPVIPVPEDEAIEVERLLEEPHDGHVTVDGVLFFDGRSSENCIRVEDASCKFGLIGHASGVGDTLREEVLDIIPSDTEGGYIHQAPNDLSIAYEDYLLDIELAESTTDFSCGSNRGLLRNSASESQTRIRRSESGDSDNPSMSGSSRVSIGEPKCQNDPFDMVIPRFHQLSSHEHEKRMLMQHNWSNKPASFTIQNCEKLEDVSSLYRGGISQDDSDKDIFNDYLNQGLTSGDLYCSSVVEESNHFNLVNQNAVKEGLDEQKSLEKSSEQASAADGVLTQKRLRKPTRRYIDESVDAASKSVRKKDGPTFTSNDTFLNARCKKRNMEPRAMRLSPEEYPVVPIQVPFSLEDLGECEKKQTKSIQVPFSSEVRGEGEKKHKKAIKVPLSSEVKDECEKKRASVAMVYSEDETSVVESEDDVVTTMRSDKRNGRRKHHKLWTIQEVRKLIDGVSKYGVGKWTHIKKLSFSSSPHRTAVDLKDKWRNLLKASSLQDQSNGVDEKQRKLAWRPLPKCIIRRVNELAALYPYPKNSRSKVSNGCQVSPSP